MTVKGKTKLSLVAMLLVLALTLVLSAAPAAAGGCCGCCHPVGTPGYWKNHPDAWPVEEITVGGVLYSKAEAIAWLDAPVKGNKSVTMFKALVAAKLNVYDNCCCYVQCILPTISEANGWLSSFPIEPGVRANSEAWQHSHGEALYWALDAYNNGYSCAPARD